MEGAVLLLSAIDGGISICLIVLVEIGMVAIETAGTERHRDYGIDVDDGTIVGCRCKGVGDGGEVHLGWFYGRSVYVK